MRITQTYNGTTSHKPHTTGNPKDYPIDEGGKDTGREAFYCPCDEIVIRRIYGVGNKGVNTVFYSSTSLCDFADGTRGYLFGLITHSNDSDLKRLKVGQKFKRGEKVCYEGTNGGVGMHAHLSFGKGDMKGNGWTKNSNGKYVLYSTAGSCKPEAICYIDKSFTKVINANGLKFKELPKSETVSKTVYLPKYTGQSVSIVDALDAMKIDSSYSYRAKIAAANDIKNYKGTPNQNTQILNLLKQGKAIKP